MRPSELTDHDRAAAKLPRTVTEDEFGLQLVVAVMVNGPNAVSRGEALHTRALEPTTEFVPRLISDALISDDSLDVPGITWLEHLNLLTGPKPLANHFYSAFLGLVTQPGSSWHLNLGAQQLHLTTAAEGSEHVLTGEVGLVVPSLAAVRAREESAREALRRTKFNMSDYGEHLVATCPWGNRYVIREPTAFRRFASVGIPTEPSPTHPRMVQAHFGLDEGNSVRTVGGVGIRYVTFTARHGTVERIGRFYSEIFGASVLFEEHEPPAIYLRTATVLVGPSVHLVFCEHCTDDLSYEEERRQAGTGAGAAGGEGLHLCIYVAHFKAAFERLAQLGLVWTNPRFAHLDTCDSYSEAHASRQFRFKEIVDLETRQPLLEIEHEVRAQRHFQFFKSVHYPTGSGL